MEKINILKNHMELVKKIYLEMGGNEIPFDVFTDIVITSVSDAYEKVGDNPSLESELHKRVEEKLKAYYSQNEKNPAGKPAGFDERVFMEKLWTQALNAFETIDFYEKMKEKENILKAALRRANQNLKIQKARMESIVQSMEDAVIAVDNNGETVLLNNGWKELLKGEPGMDTQPARESVMQGFEEVFKTRSAIRREFAFGRDGKERFFSGVFAPIGAANGSIAGSVAVLRDITEIKELDRMKSEFLNMVSHELRTPLTPIMTYGEIMATRELEADKVKKYASIICKETHRLSALIADLLDLARLEAGKKLELDLQEFDYKEVVDGSVELFSGPVAHRISVINKVGSVVIDADKNKLTQVISNLLSNAIKYSPGGGIIDVEFWVKDNSVFTSVRDKGIGIPEEDFPYIFDKFYRVKDETVNKIGGTGIGLSIVKHIVELHGGNIEVRSEIGKGSEFLFRIPITQGGKKNGQKEKELANS
jgi:PAS domain S-box-containing protein